MCLISIIIPTFNSQATIRACLDSVVSQDYRKIEIVVVDGKSTDTTIDIIKEFALKFDNIKWSSERDGGIYDAMNKGIERAIGDWIYFLGSDDCLYDSKVFLDVVKVLKNPAFDIVYGDAIMLSNAKREGGEFNMHRLLTDVNICHQAMFYRKSVFLEIGNYNLEYPIVADWDFNIRCFRALYDKIKYIARDIVLFNNISGISSKSYDDPFYQLVPAFYKGKIWKLENQVLDLKLSREYKIGSVIYKFFKNTGLIKIMKKLR